MRILRYSWRVGLALTLLGAAPSLQAQTKSLEAIIPWEGEGRVFQVEPNTMLFLGAFEGIMYAETSEGDLDEAFVMCPLSQTMDTRSGATSGSGYCAITVTGADTVYAEWTCAGLVGGCQGDFTLTGGTGRFQGITGSSELLVRSPLQALVADMASGSALRVASGLALLPKLRYRIPEE